MMPWWRLIVVLVVTGRVCTGSGGPVVAPSGGSFCPGEEVVFNCQVEGTERLVWKSSEYIGTGGDELAFSTVSPTGDLRSNGLVDETYALLVSTNEIAGKINSTLHLRIQFNGIVSCIADPPGQMTNITISIIDTPTCQLGGVITTTTEKNFTTAPSAEPLTSKPETEEISSAPYFSAAGLTVYVMAAAMIIDSFEGS